MTVRVLLIVLLAGTLAAFRPGTAGADEALVLGVHPFLPATDLMQKFSPLAAYLERELGRPVRVDVSRNYDDHVRRVGEGAFDIAYLGPASYVRLVDSYGRQTLLARLEIQGSPVFHGHVFVREDSPLRSLEELKGASVAFGSASSTMSNLVPRYMLRKKGISLEELQAYTFLTNHDNVALAVLVGEFDAGAVKEETFTKYRPQGLRSLALTPAISEHLFVASSGMPREAAAAVRDALLRTGTNEDGRRALRAIKGTATGLVPVLDGDYDNLRTVLREVEGSRGSD